MLSKKFEEIFNRVPKKIKNFNRMSMSVAAILDDIIKNRFKNHREFADFMGKKESEISKWLSGKHNFTIKSIALIESKLDVRILFTNYDFGGIKQDFPQSSRNDYPKRKIPISPAVATIKLDSRSKMQSVVDASKFWLHVPLEVN